MTGDLEPDEPYDPPAVFVGPFFEELRTAPRSVRLTLCIEVAFVTWLLLFMMTFIPWVIARWGFSYNLG